jgi:hypothetical protein
MVQQLRKSITTLVFFLVGGGAWAQTPSAPITLKPDAPERYVVVPGDTLWGISQRYTDSPWRWPELWNMNREQIRNPHLIYPGYVLVLDRERGVIRIESPEARDGGGATTGTPPQTSGPAGTVKLSPRVRAESVAGDAIPSIPASAIEPFLSRPLLVEPDGLDKAPTIVATETDRVILASGNSAYVRGVGDSKEASWYVYRRGGPLIDPDTNQTLGYEAVYLGTAQLTRRGDPATMVLTSVQREVEAGDKLIAVGRPQPINYAPRAPATKIRGRVMSIYGGLGKVGEAGPQSIITVNRGRADGIEPGHVLALYSRSVSVRDTTKAKDAPDATIALPEERAGLAFVFRVFDRVSYAIVMQLSRPVSPLDVATTP